MVAKGEEELLAVGMTLADLPAYLTAAVAARAAGTAAVEVVVEVEVVVAVEAVVEELDLHGIGYRLQEAVLAARRES